MVGLQITINIDKQQQQQQLENFISLFQPRKHRRKKWSENEILNRVTNVHQR